MAPARICTRSLVLLLCCVWNYLLTLQTLSGMQYEYRQCLLDQGSAILASIDLLKPFLYGHRYCCTNWTFGLWRIFGSSSPIHMHLCRIISCNELFQMQLGTTACLYFDLILWSLWCLRERHSGSSCFFFTFALRMFVAFMTIRNTSSVYSASWLHCYS